MKNKTCFLVLGLIFASSSALPAFAEEAEFRAFESMDRARHARDDSRALLTELGGRKLEQGREQDRLDNDSSRIGCRPADTALSGSRLGCEDYDSMRDLNFRSRAKTNSQIDRAREELRKAEEAVETSERMLAEAPITSAGDDQRGAFEKLRRHQDHYFAARDALAAHRKKQEEKGALGWFSRLFERVSGKDEEKALEAHMKSARETYLIELRHGTTEAQVAHVKLDTERLSAAAATPNREDLEKRILTSRASQCDGAPAEGRSISGSIAQFFGNLFGEVKAGVTVREFEKDCGPAVSRLFAKGADEPAAPVEDRSFPGTSAGSAR